MLRVRHYSITTKLTRMNMLVSGAALLLACAAFIAYDMVSFRDGMVHNLSIQAQVAGSNPVSALLFNDPRSAESTLSALKVAPNIISASIYTVDGQPFAIYRRQSNSQALDLASDPFRQNGNPLVSDDGQLVLVHRIVFQGKPTGVVYIRSDLQELTRASSATRGSRPSSC